MLKLRDCPWRSQSEERLEEMCSSEQAVSSEHSERGFPGCAFCRAGCGGVGSIGIVGGWSVQGRTWCGCS